MTYLGWRFEQYDNRSPESLLVYHGDDLGAARAAVIEGVQTHWFEGRAAYSAPRGHGISQTSDFAMVGSMPYTPPDPDEIIHHPAVPAEWSIYNEGQIWNVVATGIYLSDLQCRDTHARVLKWRWSRFRKMAD